MVPNEPIANLQPVAELFAKTTPDSVLDLRLAREQDITWPTGKHFKAVICSPEQRIEFGHDLSAASDTSKGILLQNGATFIGYPPYSSDVVIRDRIPQSVQFAPDGTLSITSLPRPVFDKCIDTHREIFLDHNGRPQNIIEISIENAAALGRLLKDLGFYEKNPDVPLENFGSRLDNFEPKNESQRELLDFARKLLDLPDLSRPAGLRLIGSVGTGKTHMSIAVAKEFMTRGLPTNYVTEKSHHKFSTEVRGTNAQVWILDDVNSQFGMYYSFLKDVVIQTHQYGGRIFLTSNMNPQDLDHGYFSNEAERVRFTDRSRGLFKTIVVSGESQRSSNSWYES